MSGVRARYRKKTLGNQVVGRTGVQVWLIVNLLNKGHDEKFVRTIYPKLTKEDVKKLKELYSQKSARVEIDREIRYQTGGI